MSYNYLFKYIIIGDTSVGKSCLLLQFIDRTFRQKHEITIGVEFGSKIMKIGDKSVKLQVWDTAGQESFRSITRGYYRSAAVALLVYDITNTISFKNVEKWLDDLKMHCSTNIEVILVGNKSDLNSERKVSYEEGAALAKSKNIPFIEVSAKTNEKIDDVFKQPAKNILNKIENGIIRIDKNTIGIKESATNHCVTSTIAISDSKDIDKKKKTCC
jgi:Ras-related protein Rab-2A